MWLLQCAGGTLSGHVQCTFATQARHKLQDWLLVQQVTCLFVICSSCLLCALPSVDVDLDLALTQAATSGNQGQSRHLPQAHASNGASPTAQPSATLDPIFVGQQLRHARRPSPQPGLPTEGPLAYQGNAFTSPAVWQQESVQQQQRAASPAPLIGASYMGQAPGSYMLPAQRASNRFWSGSEQPGQSTSVSRSVPSGEETGANGLALLSGWQDRNDAASQGLDPLHSAQGDYAITHLCALKLWNGDE